MRHHYTDGEIRKALSELTVIVDSREQVNFHLISWFDGKGIQHVTRALETGDLSARPTLTRSPGISLRAASALSEK